MYQKSRFAIYTGVFAALYSFCFYKNLTSITFTLFVIATLVYEKFCAKQFGREWKKNTKFFEILVTIIGISHPLTDKTFIHVFNFIFGFSILIYIAISQFSNAEDWSFGVTFKNLFKSVFGAIGKIGAPFSDYSSYKTDKAMQAINEEEFKEKKKKAGIVALTIFLTLPALIIVTAILSSADDVFKKLINTIFSDWSYKIPEYFVHTVKICILSFVVFLLAYGLFTYLLKDPFSKEIKAKQPHDATAAITAGILFDIVYLAFSLIQVLYLFIGRFALPAGINYANYARKGFFQVLFVCVLNLIMVLIGKSKFENNRLLKIILTIMCGCTYIMIASSAMRLLMYIRYYYFSFMRILAFWALSVVFLLLTGILIHIWTDKIHLFRFSFKVILIAYTVLALSHTDYFVAELNMSKEITQSDFFVADGYDDYDYIIEKTCLDAAPAVEKYNFSNKGKFYSHNNADRKVTVRNFNLSKFIAKKLKAD